VSTFPGKNDSDIPAAHFLPLLKQRGKGRRAASLGGIVGIGEQRPHRRFHLVVAYYDHTFGAAPGNGESRRARGAARHAICDTCRHLV
jgi:hypothetical protein